MPSARFGAGLAAENRDGPQGTGALVVVEVQRDRTDQRCHAKAMIALILYLWRVRVSFLSHSASRNTCMSYAPRVNHLNFTAMCSRVRRSAPVIPRFETAPFPSPPDRSACANAPGNF